MLFISTKHQFQRATRRIFLGRCFFSSDNTTTSIVYDKQFINGSFVPSLNTTTTTDKFLTVSDSNTGQPYASVIRGTKEDTISAIRAARDAFPGWSSSLDLNERKEYVRALLQIYVTQKKDQVAKHLQHELGAPAKFAKNVQSAMFDLHLKEYLKVVDEYEFSTTNENKSLILRKEPIGVVGAITPWNWPLNQLALKMIPALLSGCTMVLKPSEVTPINAYLIAEAIQEANFPPGVFNMICGTGSETAQVLATHPEVDMISFTGSTAVGAKLHAMAPLKRVRTELGGKSASIICEDATEEQIRWMAGDILENSGQTCSALSRMLIPKKGHSSRHDEIIGIIKDVLESSRVVDATTDMTNTKRNDIGPLSSASHFKRVKNYIDIGIKTDGATILTGGLEFPDTANTNLDPRGYFVRPTAFINVTNDMIIAREEIFGPVLSILSYDTEEQAIQIANDTKYGLSNAVVSSDEDRAVRIAKQLQSGQVHINCRHGGMQTPFGGYKESGDGREQGVYGLEEFLQIKAINLPPHRSSSSS